MQSKDDYASIYQSYGSRMRKVKNIAASVRARLLKVAKNTKRDFNAVLLQYFQERLLYRLSISKYRENFILKGALLFLIYEMPRNRPTKDIDFLGVDTSNEEESLLNIMKEVAVISADDGVWFDPESFTSERITEQAEYNGVRIYCIPHLEQAKIRFHFDIGFGDTVVPNTIKLKYPTLLEDSPTPEILAYPPETAIAEKFDSIVRLGYATSRLKDFFDIYYMAHHYEFQSDTLHDAIDSKFKNRGTNITEKSTIFSLSLIHI